MKKTAFTAGARPGRRPRARMARHWTWKVALLLEPARRAAGALGARLRA